MAAAAPDTCKIAADPDKRTIDVSKLTDSFTCPVSLSLLTEAVSLIPCSHKINESIAIEMFGKQIPGSWRLLKEGFCPLCRQKVEGYSIDHTIRGLVAQIFGDDSSKVITPMSSGVPSAEPYPGKNAKFNVNKDCWEEPLYGEIQFISLDSFIYKITLSTWKGPNFNLCIFFNSKADIERIDRYFQSNAFPPMNDADKKSKSYNLREIPFIRKFFKILTEHNEFPRESFEKIKRIFEI